MVMAYKREKANSYNYGGSGFGGFGGFGGGGGGVRPPAPSISDWKAEADCVLKVRKIIRIVFGR
jgi:hypothetical protein